MLSISPTVSTESSFDRLKRECAAGGVDLVTPEALSIAATLLRVALDPVAAKAAVESFAADAAKLTEARTAFDAAKREHDTRAAALDAKAASVALRERAIETAKAQLAADRDALEARAADVAARIEKLDRVRSEFAKAS